MISRGMDLAPGDIQVIVPMITTFCSLLMLLITTLHDTEFYRDDSGKLQELKNIFNLTIAQYQKRIPGGKNF